jgi:hypothetical protein
MPIDLKVEVTQRTDSLRSAVHPCFAGGRSLLVSAVVSVEDRKRSKTIEAGGTTGRRRSAEHQGDMPSFLVFPPAVLFAF